MADTSMPNLVVSPFMTGPAAIGPATRGSVPNDTPQHRKLEKAAQDFEGMLLNSLWKSMAEGMKGDLDDDSTNSTFTDMGMQAISGAMASAGGLGIGHMLLKALEKQQAIEVAKGAGTGVTEGNGSLTDKKAVDTGQTLPPSKAGS
jgi:Rod binding domain-containing protein